MRNPCPVCKTRGTVPSNNTMGNWSLYTGEGMDDIICKECNEKIALEWHEVKRLYSNRPADFKYSIHRERMRQLQEFNGAL